MRLIIVVLIGILMLAFAWVGYVGSDDHSYARGALGWLERAYERGSPNMPPMVNVGAFDKLRDQPRFQALLRKMNLPMPPS